MFAMTSVPNLPQPLNGNRAGVRILIRKQLLANRVVYRRRLSANSVVDIASHAIDGSGTELTVIVTLSFPIDAVESLLELTNN